MRSCTDLIIIFFSDNISAVMSCMFVSGLKSELLTPYLQMSCFWPHWLNKFAKISESICDQFDPFRRLTHALDNLQWYLTTKWKRIFQDSKQSVLNEVDIHLQSIAVNKTYNIFYHFSRIKQFFIAFTAGEWLCAAGEDHFYSLPYQKSTKMCPGQNFNVWVN